MGALFVGHRRSLRFAFWASAFKEVIVFTMILPILVCAFAWRGGHFDEEH
jgi:hypothetical protein